MLNHEDPVIRLYATGKLSEYAENKHDITGVVPQLLKATRDKSPVIRRWTVSALIHSKDKRAVPDLIRVANSDPDPDIRDIATYGLGDLGHVKEGIVPLSNLLMQSMNKKKVREAQVACAAIANMARKHEGNPELRKAVMVLKRAILWSLNHRESHTYFGFGSVPKNAAIALGLIGDVTALSVLEFALKKFHDSDYEITDELKGAIKRIKLLNPNCSCKCKRIYDSIYKQFLAPQ